MKSFLLKYQATTFPSGQVEDHTLIVTDAPDKEHVQTMFSTIMNADTSKLHNVTELTDTIDTTNIRVVKFPKSML